MRTHLALGPALLAHVVALAAPAAAPNFVFILADDLGQRDLSCYGNTFYETPNLDRLACGGVRFTDAYRVLRVFAHPRQSPDGPMAATRDVRLVQEHAV